MVRERPITPGFWCQSVVPEACSVRNRTVPCDRMGVSYQGRASPLTRLQRGEGHYRHETWSQE